jgi:hypothetical protein
LGRTLNYSQLEQEIGTVNIQINISLSFHTIKINNRHFDTIQPKVEGSRLEYFCKIFNLFSSLVFALLCLSKQATPGIFLRFTRRIGQRFYGLS